MKNNDEVTSRFIKGTPIVVLKIAKLYVDFTDFLPSNIVLMRTTIFKIRKASKDFHSEDFRRFPTNLGLIDYSKVRTDVS